MRIWSYTTETLLICWESERYRVRSSIQGPAVRNQTYRSAPQPLQSKGCNNTKNRIQLLTFKYFWVHHSHWFSHSMFIYCVFFPSSLLPHLGACSRFWSIGLSFLSIRCVSCYKIQTITFIIIYIHTFSKICFSFRPQLSPICPSTSFYEECHGPSLITDLFFLLVSTLSISTVLYFTNFFSKNVFTFLCFIFFTSQ
jgi:hypothetical protein